MSENIYFSRSSTKHFDWVLFILTIGIIGIGLISLYSATYDSNMSNFFYKQLISAGIGLVLMLAITYIPESWIKFNSWIVYAISILLLLVVAFFGVEINGTKGWLRFGGFSLQPAEFAKIGVLLATAFVMSKKGFDIHTWRDLATVLLITIFPSVLIMKQPDFGTATVIFAMLYGILLWSGFNSFVLFSIISLPFLILFSFKGDVWFYSLATVLSLVLFVFRKNLVLTLLLVLVFFSINFISDNVYEHLSPHQQLRIQTFVAPEANPLGAGYNVIQSVMAVGSGGLTGKGFLQGTQTQLRYIPMQWTDFIFSVPTEEFGFIGGVLVILLLFSIIWRIVYIASIIHDSFHSIVCIGAASILFYHSFINIGMAIGIMPVMGIPLPFMSYGGTFIISNLILIGLILNIYRTHFIKRSI